MPWDIGAGIAGAAKVGGDLMLDSVKRERNLADARSMEDMKAAIEQEKQKRIAEIVGGVSRTKDVEIAGPTEDGSSLGTTKQQKTEHEYSREVGDELTKRGLINEAGKFYDRADKHEDRTERASDRDEDRKVRAAAQVSADEKWRKQFDETLRHNKAIEARAGAERISPAARAQLELASTQVSSAHKEETLAAKSLEAMRKNPLANPEQIAQAEQEYKLAKEGVRQAIRNYDELGAGHFGDKWKRSSEVAPAPAVPAGAPAIADRVVGRIYDTPRGPMEWAGSDKGWKPAVGGSKPAAPGLVNEPQASVNLPKINVYGSKEAMERRRDELERIIGDGGTPRAERKKAEEELARMQQ